MSAGCDQNRGSALNKRLRPLIPKPPGNRLRDAQSRLLLPASEASIGPPRNLDSEDAGMPMAAYQKLQTHMSDLLRMNSGREIGTCRALSLSPRWNPTTEQVNMLENLYKRGIRTPSAEQIQYITAQLRRYGKIEGKNVFYWFQNHKARERQKRRRRMEMLQLEQAVPAIHSDTVKPPEVAAGCTTSHWMTSSSLLATSSILEKEPEPLKSFLKLAMPSAEEDEEEERRRTSNIITQKNFQQRPNSTSVNAANSELTCDGPQSSEGVSQDDREGFFHANPSATARCSTVRLDGLQTLELFPLRSCSSIGEEESSLVQSAGSESSLMEPNSSASLSCSSCTDERRNSASPQHNGRFGFIKHDGDTIGGRTDDEEDEQFIYVKRDEHGKRQQLPCRFFQFLPLRM